jgi:hypothetical protein
MRFGNSLSILWLVFAAKRKTIAGSKETNLIALVLLGLKSVGKYLFFFKASRNFSF